MWYQKEAGEEGAEQQLPSPGKRLWERFSAATSNASHTQVAALSQALLGAL